MDRITDSQGVISFKAHVQSVRTGLGTWKITLELFESDLTTAAKLPGFYQKNVEVGMVLIPEGN